VDFWRKRIARIWPAYLVALAGALLIGIGTVEGVSGYLKHLSLTQLWFEDRSGFGLRVSWTLVVEITFYVLILPLAAALRRAGPHAHDAWLAATVGLFALGCAAIVYVRHPTAPGFRILPPYLPSFAGGMLLAITEFRGDRGGAFGAVTGAVQRIALNARLCFGVAIGLLLALTILMPANDHFPATDSPNQRMIQSFVQTLIAVFALAPLAMQSTPARLLETKLLVALGTASFGFYLWHVQVLKVFESMLHDPADATALVGVGLAILGAFVMGEVSRRVVEEPARKIITATGHH
jgi:peptidoglycan/LPS O-acetylase OafA/YrhL